jgi:hypothetical protein
MITYLDSDLRLILGSGEISERVEFDVDGQKINVPCVIDRPQMKGPALEPAAGMKAPYMATHIQVTLASSDLPSPPKKNDVVEFGGQKYKIWRVIMDGQGMCTVAVHEVNQ